LRLADYVAYHLLKQQGVVAVGALQAACHQRERGRSEQAAPTVLVEDASGGIGQGTEGKAVRDGRQ
jgi:hypothetical protein